MGYGCCDSVQPLLLPIVTATFICVYSINSCASASVGLSPLLFRERKSIAASFKVGGSSTVTDASNEYRTQAFGLLALMF